MRQTRNHQDQPTPLVCSLLVKVPPLMKAITGVMLVTTTPALIHIHPVIAMLSFLIGLIWMTTSDLDTL